MKILILSLLLSGCMNNATIHKVVKDIEATADCDTSPVFVDAKDDKSKLAGRIIVLNAKLDDCDNSKHFTKKKIDRYLEID